VFKYLAALGAVVSIVMIWIISNTSEPRYEGPMALANAVSAKRLGTTSKQPYSAAKIQISWSAANRSS
jgi:hypothetical protein